MTATSPPQLSIPRHGRWLDLGLRDYREAHEIQLWLHGRRLAGAIADTAIAVEHFPCITYGRAADLGNIVAGEEQLRAAGVSVYSTDRGGDVTYHGPGQLVLYPIVDLAAYGKDVHAHARRLEQVLIAALDTFGVAAGRRPEYPGVWSGRGKIGAIGLRVSRWVTLHGVSLNVGPDMSHFALIVPCGIRRHAVTSLEEALGRPVKMAEVKAKVREAFELVFAMTLADADPSELEDLGGPDRLGGC